MKKRIRHLHGVGVRFGREALDVHRLGALCIAQLTEHVAAIEERSWVPMAVLGVDPEGLVEELKSAWPVKLAHSHGAEVVERSGVLGVALDALAEGLKGFLYFLAK